MKKQKKYFGGEVDLNSGPLEYESDALPTELNFSKFGKFSQLGL